MNSQGDSSVLHYRRMVEVDDDMWEMLMDGDFIGIAMTNELPFELPVHTPSETLKKAEEFTHYNDEELDRLIEELDPFEIEMEQCRRFE